MLKPIKKYSIGLEQPDFSAFKRQSGLPGIKKKDWVAIKKETGVICALECMPFDYLFYRCIGLQKETMKDAREKLLLNCLKVKGIVGIECEDMYLIHPVVVGKFLIRYAGVKRRTKKLVRHKSER